MQPDEKIIFYVVKSVAGRSEALADPWSFFDTLVTKDTILKLNIMSRVLTPRELKIWTNSVEFFTWCGEWSMRPLNRRTKCWAKR
jgi:hypothetical protein